MSVKKAYSGVCSVGCILIHFCTFVDAKHPFLSLTLNLVSDLGKTRMVLHQIYEKLIVPTRHEVLLFNSVNGNTKLRASSEMNLCYIRPDFLLVRKSGE